MLDENILQDALKEYRKYFFERGWENEKYKWKAVYHFQQVWDVNAEDFAGMLKDSLSKTNNLLMSMNKFPARMIVEMAESSPEEVRKMFLDLFDESRDVVDRIEEFKETADLVFEKLGTSGRSHFQYENAISTYLWLRYPDKYYIYKFSEVKNAAVALKSGYEFKKGDYRNNLVNFYAFYNDLCDCVSKDEETTTFLKQHLEPDCYSDPKFKTLTIDFGFYISRFYTDILAKRDNGAASVSDTEWYPSDYSPELTTQDWLELINNKEVFQTSSLEIMKRLLDIGGQATCTQLAKKYGEKKNFYMVGSVALAKRVAAKTGCPVMRIDDDNKTWWPILYVGKEASLEEAGTYIWRLRPELKEALQKTDLSGVKLYAENFKDHHHYWWLNASPKIWSFSALRVGESEDFTLYNENGNKRHIFQNFLDAKEGDLVIGYESEPTKQIVALARISSASDGKAIYVEKTENLLSPIDYKTLKNSVELQNMEFFHNPNGTLFKLTEDEYAYIMDLVRDENPKGENAADRPSLKTYTEEDFLSDVYMSQDTYHRLRSLLENKMNVILQGAPGVGKTFAAKRLAYSIMGVKDDSRIQLVQFHQNYSYEDFMMGYRPSDNGFELKYGIFYQFCQKAANRPAEPFFFLIDEINRGNISKIFGELMMLLEKDHRSEEVTLAYTGMPFSIPENVYLIGTMNTADRSLAMIDYALRRRFGFFEMRPGFDSDGFISYQRSLDNETFDLLIEKVKDLNLAIQNDSSLGRGFCIGHSYFCGRKKEECTDEWMQSVVDYDILPMLEEYWFDDEEKVTHWDNVLHGVFQ